MRDPYARYYGNKEKGRTSSRRTGVIGLDDSWGKAGKEILGRWGNLSKGLEVEATWCIWGPRRANFSVQKVKKVTRNRVELSSQP